MTAIFNSINLYIYLIAAAPWPTRTVCLENLFIYTFHCGCVAAMPATFPEYLFLYPFNCGSVAVYAHGWFRRSLYILI